MERGFYNEDFNFEELLKQKSDPYRMYPSESVWKGIYTNLHTKRRWYLTGILLFLGAAGYLSTENFLLPHQPQDLADRKYLQQQKSTLPSAEPSYPRTGTRNGIASKESLGYTAPASPVTTRATVPTKVIQTQLRLSNLTNDAAWYAVPIASPDIDFNPPAGRTINYSAFRPVKPEWNLYGVPEARVTGLTLDRQQGTIGNQPSNKRINWLQENAVHQLSLSKVKRVSWQMSVTPTMTYRKLVGNDFVNLASDVKNIPIALNFSGNIDNLLNHKPAMGVEVGSMFLYALNKNVTFKTGVQFNYSRYDIQAYSSASTERATISLFNYSGAGELTSYTRLRNFGGNEVKDLKNEFYHLTTPVGMEWVVLGQRKLQLAVAASLQPTYHLNRNNYLITTDYKNYTKAPSLVRRWNMHSSAEAFLSYKSKGLKYQLGPQFRYQLFSTYSDKYPVKEFLMEFGLKFAVTRDIR